MAHSALDQAIGQGRDPEDREGEGDAVRQSEGSHDLEQREEPAARQQERSEEEKMVVARQDVLDAQSEESAGRR